MCGVEHYPQESNSMDHKADVRNQVFATLRTVAYPDSRFHYDFGELAVDRLLQDPLYQAAKCIFITPDNCLEQLRYRALLDGKDVLTTSYSIKRGFWLLRKRDIPPEKLLYAATLDGMERVGKPLSLKDIARELPRVDYLVTGTGAINEQGIRFGKGHGFFDAEWGMLHRVGVLVTATPVAAVVHDCQVLEQELHPEIFDTVVDVIFTPTRTITVTAPHKPDCGIVWSLLDPHMYDTIPPLQELKTWEAQGLVAVNRGDVGAHG
jgi:5-formyltetrahydrofolate cyclo-ligase